LFAARWAWSHSCRDWPKPVTPLALQAPPTTVRPASPNGERAQPRGDRVTTERQLDPAALGSHIDRLYRAAWRLCGSREDAEDLVQETFLQVLRRPRFLFSDEDVGYLLRTMRNTFISDCRTAARRPRVAQISGESDIVDASGWANPEASIEAAALYEAIATLPDCFRDSVMAVDVLGLSYREAARALHVCEATLATRVHRGRQRIADVLRID
jgi:RNA polymerase sigma-70 factor, ECF subfamily